MNENNYKERPISANTSQLAVTLQPYQNYSPEDLPGEVWRDVVGYEGIYQISSLGRVKSLARTDCRGQRRKERILRQSFDSDKYLILSLSKDSNVLTKKVHRLVSLAFIPNPDNLPVVNHINGIKTDNRVENLEWCSAKSNVHHAVDMGLRKSIKGENNRGCVLTDKDVIDIYKSGLTNKQLSRIYPVSELAINRIKIGKTWGHLTGHKYKQRYPSQFLSKDVVLGIFNSNNTVKEISEQFSVPDYIVNCIKRGQTYSKITGKTDYVKQKRK